MRWPWKKLADAEPEARKPRLKPWRAKLEAAAKRLIEEENLPVDRIHNVMGLSIRAVQLWGEDGVLLAELRLNSRGDVLRVYHRLYMRSKDFEDYEK